MSQSIDPFQEKEFKMLQLEGKQLASEGRLKESLQKFELAKKICPTAKVLRRIEKLKECLKPVTKDVIYDGNSQVLNDIQNVQKPSTSRITSKSADLSPVSQSKFRELKKCAKESAYTGNYDEALEYFRKALTICNCPNVKRYMQEIQLVISSNEEEMLKTKGVSDSREKKASSSSLVQETIQKNKSPIQTLDSNESDIEQKLAKVKVLYEEARDLAADGRLTTALKVLKKAQAIHETQKVQKKIDKLEEIISTDLNDSESNQMIKIADDFSVFHDIYNKLYPYQREGIAWMWKLYRMGKGGVLGDDMGLGKTFQVIAFISGMIDADLVKHVLIIMPVSLLPNWAKEFKKWCPGIAVHSYHGSSKKEREKNLLRVQKRGHVLLTSYGMLMNNVRCMIEMEGNDFVWDYVVLDEGHKIKNPTKTTKAVYEIPSKHRLVLTGTPIQNNLRELWSLFDFVQQGTLLGSAKTFKMQYENHITRSREKDATAGEKRLGTEMAENLKSLIRPYFLRRTKEEIWGNNINDDIEQLEGQMEKMTISKLKSKKNDLILWTYMSESQVEIYTSFLHSDAVKSILVSKRSPLVELTTLKKICDHPRLLSQRACLHLGLNGELQHEDLERELDDESTMASSIENVSDETLLHESGKLKLVLQLLENLKDTGHRTLIFSLSRKILDMIHRILVNRNWKVMRLDGTVSKIEERERRIHRFQNDPSYPVFLLTTQVGGVGITLTAADRVIIYDPSWNPATDAQAVDRVYRIGQEKDVIVYRLITCGSVEEKIYRRQIFKDSITRQATGVADPYRYFSKQELRELFSLDNVHYSATQVQLSEMHSSQQHMGDELKGHIEYLKTLNIFNISEHDLMFSRNIQDDTEDNDEAAVSDNFIKKQVAAANELIKMEASVAAEGIRAAGTYNRPYQEALPVPKKPVKDLYKPPILPEVIDLTENAKDSMFLSSKQRSILEDYKTSNENFKTHSLDSSYQGIPLDEAQSSFPAQTKIENFFSVDGKEKIHSITPKSIDTFSLKAVIPDLKSDKTIESSGLNHMNTSHNIEKLRKSLDCIEPSLALPDKVDQAFMDGKRNSVIISDKNTSVNLDEKQSDDEDNEAHGDVLSISLKEQNASDELEPLKLTPEFQGKYKNNLTELTVGDLKDLSFDLEVSDRYVKGPRQSCARKSTFMISDSDSSHQSSNESNLNTTVNLVHDSEDAPSEASDSSNSASLSFVPDSTPNSPENNKLPKAAQFVSETPPRVFSVEPESLSENISFKSDNSSFRRKFEGNVGRITPLKVDRKQTSQNSSFAQAMATSLILSPYTSPVKSESKPISVSSENSSYVSSKSRLEVPSSSEDDSPIKCLKKKKKPMQISSDSEDSENEQQGVQDLDLFPNKATDKNNSNDRKSSYSNHSNVKNLASDECSDSEHSSVSDGDNPIKFMKEKKPMQINSDSEDSENEQQGDLDLFPNKATDKNNSNYRKSSYSNHSNVKNLSSDECNDSEHSSISDGDNPIKFMKKNKPILISSESEESDNEQKNATYDNSIKFTKKKKPLQICSHSEESDNEQENVIDQALPVEQVSNKNSSEDKNSSMYDDISHSGTEHSTVSDSDSEYSNISEGKEIPSSDESGSVFDQDENDSSDSD